MCIRDRLTCVNIFFFYKNDIYRYIQARKKKEVKEWEKNDKHITGTCK